MTMRDDAEQFLPLGPKVDKPKPEPKPEWQKTDRPGIERNTIDGKLRNTAPTPPPMYHPCIYWHGALARFRH